MTRLRVVASIASLAVLAALVPGRAAASGAPPRLGNARLETRPRDGVEAAIRSVGKDPAWVAWAVPAQDGRSMCCWTSDESSETCPGCRLEGEGHGFQGTRSSPVGLEADDRMVVLVRVADGGVDRIRHLSWSCGIDAGGRRVLWLPDVTPDASLRFLSGQVTGTSSERPQAALAAIAHHAGEAADAVLEGFTRVGQKEELRKKAAFWLGVARGRRGYEVLRRLLEDDPSPEVRAHVTFAITRSEVPEAVEAVMRAARRDPSAHVRGQALFWLAQKAERRAADAITRAIAEDPETEVKERAVFALSQLPKDEGVPRLITLARTHKNPAVRRKAMFWLGQSQDPRALAFFEEVLTAR